MTPPKEKPELNEREAIMLRLAATGASNAAIAEKCGLTEGTGRVYLHNLYKKLGVVTKTQAVVWYFTKGEGAAGRASKAASQ